MTHGSWGSWSMWSSCSVSCGTKGQRQATRKCDDPKPENGGQNCTGEAKREQPCYAGPCKGIIMNSGIRLFYSLLTLT